MPNATHWGRIALETLSGLFYPAHCAHCREAVKQGWFCEKCRADIQPVREPRCAICSFTYEGAEDRFTCLNCGDRQFHFEVAVGVMHGRGVLRELVLHFKYGRAPWLAGPLAELMSEGLDDGRIVDFAFDAIVPVPLHARRERQREYNQAALLARELGKIAHIPVRNILERTRYTATQTHFDRSQRMQNLRDAFSVRQNAGVLGQNLLLVDDVLTTGSTLDECARVLKSAGAQTVCALTVARG